MFGRSRRDGDQPSADGTPFAGSISLADLVTGICRAVFLGTRHVRDQHIEATADLYVRQAGDAAANEPDVLTPRTVLMQIPAFNPVRTNDKEAPVEVPLAALAQQNPVVIDEASFELDCTVDRVFDTAEGGAPAIGITLEKTTKGAPLHLRVRMRMVDPPEGVSRVNDALMRGLQ